MTSRLSLAEKLKVTCWVQGGDMCIAQMPLYYYWLMGIQHTRKALAQTELYLGEPAIGSESNILKCSNESVSSVLKCKNHFRYDDVLGRTTSPVQLDLF